MTAGEHDVRDTGPEPTDDTPQSSPAGDPRRPGPAALTMLLTGTVAAVGAVLAVRAPTQPLVPTPPGPAMLIVLGAVLGACFLVTELGQVLVEVRRLAYSFSLAGTPLLLGVLYLPAHWLLVIRVGATAVAFGLQRVRGLKFTYNIAAYVLDTSLVLVLTRHLVNAPAHLTLSTIGGCYLALAAVDVLMSCLVLLVIRINQGPMKVTEALDVLLPATVFVVVNTVLGVICALLVSQGTLGVAALTAFVLLIVIAFRAYVVLRRRHSSLAVVQDFIRRGEDSVTVGELQEQLLTETAELLRAHSVELVLQTSEHGPGTRIAVDDGGVVTSEQLLPRPTDWLGAQVLRSGSTLLVGPQTRDPLRRRWLAEQQIKDALLVPFGHNTVRGTLIARDRVGDTTRFTRDDLGLLVTLAGHFAVALHSRMLMQRLQHEASHDVLTGLPNRALLVRRTAEALAVEGTDRAAVLLLDMNRFKEVNDALGHHVGDQLLQVVAERLSQLPLPGATVARLGGDEFAVLLAPSADPETAAVGAARQIRDSFAAPVDLVEATVSTDACIGIAVAQPEQRGTDLMRQADAAMYAAKDEGVAWQLYTPELDRGRAQRLALLADLRLALANDELEVHYQPKLDLSLGVITSVEALVRWTHPRLGRLSPDMFIPLAESSGLIEQLTWSVLGKALRQCRTWQDAGVGISVAVNLSARNVNNPDLPEQVAAALCDAGLPAHRLILEITESSVMGDPERTVPTLNRLAAIGVALSLDDFGTGYSSLSYLQRLPVREVKIDRSFILGLTDPEQERASMALVRSIIGLGRSLDLHIVAEGVETMEIVDRMRELGCHTVQGYVIGRPMPAEELVAGLAANRTGPQLLVSY